MLQRTAAVTAALVITLVSVTGCAAGPGGAASSATSAAVPELDPQVASTLDDALRTVQANPGVASATNRVELHQRYTAADGTDVTPPGLDAWDNRDAGPAAPPPIGGVSPDDPGLPPVPTPSARPTPPAGATEAHSFSSAFVVTMDPDATPSEASAVPVAMAERIAWTGVTLTLQVPAGPGHVLSTVTYAGTFDQRIPDETALGVASGLATLAATPGVTGLEASIPQTMRVDYGSLTIGVSPADDAKLARLHAVTRGDRRNGVRRDDTARVVRERGEALVGGATARSTAAAHASAPIARADPTGHGAPRHTCRHEAGRRR